MSFDTADFQSLVGEQIVVDTAAPFVYLGTLQSLTPSFLMLTDADVHDLRDSDQTRERYLMHSIRDGIRRNRREVSVRWDAVLSISKLSDVVDH